MTTEILLVLIVLIITIILFVSEKLRVDIIAILIMISLAWLGLIGPSEAFSGFASNAVIAIMGVMILSYGMGRSGVMDNLIRLVMRVAGSSEKKLLLLISGAVAFISAFMQNIGAAALFLPAVMKISKKSKLSPSRLLIPMGYATILGGTLTLVASGPLIILNDLIRPGGEQPFGIFDVTPIGIALVASGILYFLFFGKYVLPVKKEKETATPQQELMETWQLPSTVYQCIIPSKSPLIGKTREEVKLWVKYKLNLLLIEEDGEVLYAPWRYTRFSSSQKLLLMGKLENVKSFSMDYKLQLIEGPSKFEDFQKIEGAGFAELIIPPKAKIAGKSICEIAMRKTYTVEPIMILSGEKEKRGDFCDQKLQPGDTIIVHGLWENIKKMADNRDFVLVSPMEVETTGKSKPIAATFCILGAILLALSGVQLSLALFSGALAMILLKVISIDEAYKAIDWRTVFLLAGLIPLGIAMEKTGAASFVANKIIQPIQMSHPLLIMIAIAMLATIFTLFMSNVAATVILVPLVMVIGISTGTSARALALLVAVCASNSFLLPTHQVNAFIMAPGGYRNVDYLRAGIPLTAIFMVITVAIIYLIYV
ncbi:MAG: SLC13 family permease [Methanocellales archaeon]|nr:SLC13 family permease [Methanocellales archaeon]